MRVCYIYTYFCIKIFFKKTQRAFASSAYIQKKKRKENTRQLPTQTSLQCGNSSCIKELACPTEVWLWSWRCHQQAVPVGENLHSGVLDRTACLLSSSPWPAPTSSLLSVGGETVARGAEGEGCVGKSCPSISSVWVLRSDSHRVQFWLAQPLHLRPNLITFKP